jgi:hypothetical protein
VRGARADVDGLPAVRGLVEREAPAERIELRLERDVLAVQAHRLGDRRVARQAAHAVHGGEEQMVEEELRSAENEREHGADRLRARRGVKRDVA